MGQVSGEKFHAGEEKGNPRNILINGMQGCFAEGCFLRSGNLSFHQEKTRIHPDRASDCNCDHQY